MPTLKSMALAIFVFAAHTSLASDCIFLNSANIDLVGYEKAIGGVMTDFQNKVDNRGLEFTSCALRTRVRRDGEFDVWGTAIYHDGHDSASCNLFYDLYKTGEFESDEAAMDCD